MKLKDENKVIALIEATIELVYHEGLAGITINKVAKKANIAAGTVYVYFSGKEELLIHVFSVLKRRTISSISDGVNPDEPLFLAMKKMWRNYFHYYRENEKEEVFIEQFKYSPFIHKVSASTMNELEKPIHEFLDAGKEQMLIKEEDNELLQAALVGITREMAKAASSRQTPLTEQQKDRMFKMVWDSIKS